MIPTKLRPITRILATIGELPTSYLISMTYEEQILWFCNYLETIVIPAINNNADAVAELQKALEDLKTYVDEYFDNLDLQAEVDKALDEMIESGKLAEIIAEFLQMGVILGYNTKDDLKAADNVVDGSFTKTYGEDTYNDGKGNFYKIREKLSSDVPDDDLLVELTNYPDLIAEKIPNLLEEKVNEIDEKVEKLEIKDEVFIQNISALPYRYEGQKRGMQGGCYCGNDEIAVYFSETHTLQVINLQTCQVLREYTNAIFGHGNSITKIGNYLYLVGTGDANNNCYKIPYDTLNSYEIVNVYGTDKIPTGENISSIAYSSEADKVYILIAPQFPNAIIYEFTSDLSALVGRYTIPNINEYGGFVTDMGCYKNYILINYSYGKLQIIDQETKEVYKTIQVNLNAGNRYYSEIEWIDEYNDKIILASIGFVGNGYGSGNMFFGSVDLYNSYRDYPIVIAKNTTTGKYPRNNIVYVDTSITNAKRNGSYEAPFSTIYEAINSCLIEGINKTDVYLTGNFTNQQLLINNIKQEVRLYPNDDNLIRFRNIDIENAFDVLLRNCLPVEAGVLTLKECNILINYTKSTNVKVTLDAYNTSKLYLQALQNAVTFAGRSNGIIDNMTSNPEKGIIGIVDNRNNVNIDFMECRNLNNMGQRCRLDGSLHNATNRLVFYTSIQTPRNIWVQVGSSYYSLPITGISKNYSIPVNGDTLSVSVSYDTTAYTFTTFKYELSTTSAIIYDAYVTF